MNKSIIALTTVALFTGSFAADAKDVKIIQDSFTVEDNSNIKINVPVGEIELKTHDSDQVELRIEVEEKDSSWFDSVDVDSIELDKSINAKRVKLEIDEEDVVQHWVITVPRDSDLDINIGVGEAELKSVYRNVDLDVGVGEANIDVALAENYGFIEAESGVGSADIDGVSGVKERRHMVGGEVEWIGEGKYQIEVEVGVGEADINIKN
jgi:hypothetical protein